MILCVIIIVAGEEYLLERLYYYLKGKESFHRRIHNTLRVQMRRFCVLASVILITFIWRVLLETVVIIAPQHTIFPPSTAVPSPSHHSTKRIGIIILA